MAVGCWIGTKSLGKNSIDYKLQDFMTTININTINTNTQ